MRINCIPVTFLADQHLRAEWVEMLMLPAYLKRAEKSRHGIVTMESKNYILNTGHARFFYNKLKYVQNRYDEIGAEMLWRGYFPNPTLDLSMFEEKLQNDWTPNKKDMKVNIDRILTRINIKPDWYKFYGKPVNDWEKFYAPLLEEHK